jgi:hypothetical protein
LASGAAYARRVRGGEEHGGMTPRRSSHAVLLAKEFQVAGIENVQELFTT